jgi:phosphoribosylanthranilate isomerase
MIKLKICGMKNPDNIKDVGLLNPDYMGFIFYKASKRFVQELDPLAVSQLSENIAKVGVFVNHDLIEVVQTAKKYSLDLLQLHGSESADYVSALKQQLVGSDIKLMKAFGVDENFKFEALEDYERSVEYFLFDTQTPDHGGSGQQFNWDLLNGYRLEKPYFLSGGIGLESIATIKNINDERLFAIDVNSKFEIEPGIKDINKLREFKRQL